MKTNMQCPCLGLCGEEKEYLIGGAGRALQMPLPSHSCSLSCKNQHFHPGSHCCPYWALCHALVLCGSTIKEPVYIPIKAPLSAVNYFKTCGQLRKWATNICIYVASGHGKSVAVLGRAQTVLLFITEGGLWLDLCQGKAFHCSMQTSWRVVECRLYPFYNAGSAQCSLKPSSVPQPDGGYVWWSLGMVLLVLWAVSTS